MSDLERFIEAIVEAVIGTRTETQDDYALAGPAKGAGS